MPALSRFTTRVSSTMANSRWRSLDQPSRGSSKGSSASWKGAEPSRLPALARAHPAQPLLQALDQRQLGAVQLTGRVAEIRHPQHLALGHLGQLRGYPVELRREATLVRGRSAAAISLAFRIRHRDPGPGAGRQTRPSLDPQGFQGLAGEHPGPLPAPQLAGDATLQAGLLEQLARAACSGSPLSM